MQRSVRFFAVCVGLCLGFALALHGKETTGRISGTVVDAGNAAIAGASVGIRNISTGTTAIATTDQAGKFVFERVPLGQYDLSIDAKGFERFTTDQIEVKTGRDAVVTASLRVAPRKEAVTVVENGAYAVPEVAVVSKLDVPIQQIPLAIQVVPAGVIDDQLALRLPDITRNISSVQTNFGYGALYEAFAIRGFETNVFLRNGERVSGGIGRSSADVANIESVEVLKGPAGMIYGRLEPGGMINVETKKPLESSHFAIQQDFGSYNLYRTILDATGPITRDDKLLYRGIFSYYSSDQFITYAPHGQTFFVAPSLSWRPTDKLNLNANVEYRNMDPLIANGVPAIGNRPANVPISLYLGGDVGDHATVNRTLLDFNGSYRFNPNWSLHGALAVAFDAINFEQFFGGSLDETLGPTYGDFTNVPWFDKRDSTGVNVIFDLNGHFRTGNLRHTLLAGTDYYNLDFNDKGFVNGWAPVDTMNIFRPVFYRPTAYGLHDQLAATAPDWTSAGSTAWHGLYAQDQIALTSKLQLLIGGRYDWTEAKAGSITLEYADPGSTLNDVQKTIASQNRFSPTVGVLFQAKPWLSLYGNYVTSLGTWGTSNVIAVDIYGRPLPAQTSRSYEGGAKFTTANGKLQSTFAMYNITKRNVATRDLSSLDPNALRAVGEANSWGAEFDVSGSLTPHLSVIASYAYTHAKFTTDNSGLQGNWIANVPQNSGSIWLRGDMFRQRLGVGAGAFARGVRQGDNENTFQLPGYATVDAFGSYTFRTERGRLIPQINFVNLLNKTYYLNTNVYDAYPRLGIMPGQPFTVVGSIRWEY